MLSKGGFAAVLVAVSGFCLLFPGAVRAVHFLGHGMAEPSQQQLDLFCNKQYPEIRQSPQYSLGQKQEAEKLYKQHCVKQPAQKLPTPSEPEPELEPEAVAGRIDRIEGPACVAPGSEVRVRGRNLRAAELVCRLASQGQRRTLRAYSRTDAEYRFRLEPLLAGQDYGVECELPGDRDGIRLKACDAPAEQVDGTDLVPEIRAPGLRAGQTQTVEVSVLNRGRSQPGNRRHRVALALVDRDLTRTGLRTMTSALSPAAAGVLAQGRQWVLRTPGSGQSERVMVMASVPAQLPQGKPLYWCAFADSDQDVPEANEGNNLACVAATGEGGTVVRNDLTGTFGSAVRNQQRDTPQVDPDALRESLLPAGAIPAALGMILKVNDSYGIPPIHVVDRSRIHVSWNPLPTNIGGDPVTGLHVRLSETDFGENDCRGGPGAWTGDLPIGRVFADDTGDGLGAGGFQLDLATTGSGGDRFFSPGATYYVKGCVMVEHGGVNQVIDHPDSNTNIVAFVIDEPGALTYATEMAADIEALPPDLTGSFGAPIRSGPSGLKLPLAFRARNATEPGTFHYSVVLVPPWGAYSELPEPETLFSNPGLVERLGGITIGPREASIRELGFGYGNAVFLEISDYWPEWNEEVMVAMMKFNTEDVSPGGVPAYEESRYDNNSAYRVVGNNFTGVVPGELSSILNIRHAGYSGLVAIYRVQYALDAQPVSDRSIRLRVVNASTGALPDDIPGMQSALSRHPHLDCFGPSGATAVIAEPGFDRWVEFRCVVPPAYFPADGSTDFTMVATMHRDGPIMDYKKRAAESQIVHLARAETGERRAARLTLEATRTTTGWAVNAERPGCTPTASLPFAFEYTLPERSADEIMVAANAQEISHSPFCTERSNSYTDGFVYFDTESVEALVAHGMVVEYASLRFNESRNLDHKHYYGDGVRPRPASCAGKIRSIEGSDSPWRSYPDDLTLAASDARTVPGASTQSAGYVSGTGSARQADVTDLAREWVTPPYGSAETNNGVRLRSMGPDSGLDNQLCGGYYSGFALELEMLPTVGRGSASGD